MVAQNPIVETKNLGLTYPEGRIRALEGISFSVNRGEIISVIGPSGCGKSTLIKVIGDLIKPTEGTVTIDGATPEDARLAGRFSFVFQNPVLLPWRTVLENTKLPLEVGRHGTRDPRELLSMFGLGDFCDRHPHQLSGGMQQRVALARALTFDPSILLMDEPFAAVDELNRAVLNLDLARIAQETGVTVFFVTHSISEAVFLADRVFVLSARPARLKEIVEIPFSRPRDKSVQESPDFQQIVKSLRLKLE